MRIAVVGGGILGLTLSYRLSSLGHQVHIYESAPRLGGLACSEDYGDFVWDRFYHCILPQDQNLLGLLRDLGLENELRWATTGTGYYAKGRFYSMSSNADFLRFPLLSLLDKTRFALSVLYATRVADPHKLYGITAVNWLKKICGKRTYEVFWRPLLKAKLGTHYDQVAAVFIWASLKRLFGARSGTANKEKLGYVSGGYHTILAHFVTALEERGVTIHLGAPVQKVAVVGSENPACRQCEMTFSETGSDERTSRFDQVFFTAPTRLARKVASPELRDHVDRMERDYPTSESYLGIACLVLALKSPLTPYYCLNIGEETVELTGLIEMTNLIDRNVETAGKSLVYLPKYVDSEDAVISETEDQLCEQLIGHGLKRLFPDFSDGEIVRRSVHRARFVQPLPMLSDADRDSRSLPSIERPFQCLGTFMLRCATLNNNEVVGLVDEFLTQNKDQLQKQSGVSCRPSAVSE